MKAARYYGKGDIRVEDVKVPEVGPDQYLIQVEWCGICGSDLHEYTSGPIGTPTPAKPHPLTGGHLPVTLGHEFCGRIKQAPKGAELKEGENVMVDPHFTCRDCLPCKMNQEHLCQKMGFIGSSGAPGGGGLSEFVAVDGSMLYRIPDPMRIEDAAVIEPLTVAHHAVKVSGVDFQKSQPVVLIVGGGPIGYAMALTLRAHGAKRVILSEPTSTRREFAASVVEVSINPLTESVGDMCHGLTCQLGVDVVFDCAGTRMGSEDAFDAIKSGGIFVNVAMWPSTISIPYYQFFRKEVKFYSSCCYNRQDWKEIMEMISLGKFQGHEKMITRRISLADVVEKGFEELINNKDAHVKILISPKPFT